MIVFLLNFSIVELFKSKLFFDSYRKDTLYRFLELKGANWERLLVNVAKNVISDVESRTTSDHHDVLIFDDSLYRRAGGKHTQYCGRVYDHNDNKLRTGYRMMTCAWSNGDMTIPVAQALLTTQNPELRVGPFNEFDGRTVEGKRREMALKKGTDVVIDMVKTAQEYEIPFKYVLFDTWFSSPSELVALKNMGTDVVAMIKKGDTKFTVMDESSQKEIDLNITEIFNRNKKRRGRSRYLLSVTATVEREGKTIPVRLVFVRNRNKRKDWICFVSTDISIDETEILELYTIRWNIEVYFHTVKSYLKLTSECHSHSYDALTAHMVIVAIRYMVLAVDQFNMSDNRTIEQIFEQAKREVINRLVNTSLFTVLECLVEAFLEVIEPTEEQMKAIYEAFYKRLPDKWKNAFNPPKSA